MIRRNADGKKLMKVPRGTARRKRRETYTWFSVKSGPFDGQVYAANDAHAHWKAARKGRALERAI